MLGITKSDMEYRKLDKNVGDIDNVSQHLADAILAALGDKDEVHITSENVELHPPKEFHPGICTLLPKHEHIWNEKPGHIHATTHRIDLLPEARPFKPTPYRAGSKGRELEEFEIKQHHSAGFIEHSNA